MSLHPPPRRYWRSYGTDPLPTPGEALDQPFSAFPNWFLRVECDRCGKVTMLNEAHTGSGRRTLLIRVLLARLRHDGCGGSAGRVELLTGIEAASSRPVRRIVLRDEGEDRPTQSDRWLVAMLQLARSPHARVSPGPPGKAGRSGET